MLIEGSGGRHAGDRQRGGCIDAKDAGVRATRVNDLEMQRSRFEQISGIARVAGHLAEGVVTGERLPDD